MRGESGKKLGAGVGREAWGPLLLPFHTQLSLAPAGEKEVITAQALPHCKCGRREGKREAGGSRSP